ncbi:MAG: glycosyltransferase family 39 protein [Candidatus Moranbacteria bacterium]|nr:glycosyltransferase family 39 protein [Candidatus Moranbacteria bacterium]
MKFKPDWKIIIFLLIVALAVFLRVYNFSDWLFFKMDQARDASTIKQAFELGPGWLPFLGPKAGGTHVNLGPAFYYFQYLFAVLFQNVHPATLAYPDLLFSILSIPLFYFFLKKYFSRDWSMILAGLYAVCFLGIEYSRFAWNPNSLVFFNLLYFYSLLNIFDEKVKFKLRWIVVAGLSFAISTQLHFLSFATLPIITVVFALLIRKEIKQYLNWKKIAVFVGIIFLLYLPVFLNEFVTRGKNTSEFFTALKNKPSQHSLRENILRDFLYFGQYWFLILTSWISKKNSLWPAIIAWLGAIVPGLFLGRKFFRSEKNGIKQKFLLLTLLWFAAYFLMYIPIAFQIRPRFFLPIVALPFIFLGYAAKYFWDKNKKIFKAAVAVFLAVMLLGNLYGTYFWFKEIKSSQKRGVYPKRTIILKARDGIVLWHLERAADYMKKNCQSKEIYYEASSEYKRPVKYILDLRGIKAESIDAIEVGSQDQCVFALGLSRTGKIPADQKIDSEFDIGETQKIGALSVYKLSLKEKFFGQPLPTYNKAAGESERSNRVFWKDLWK